jgi:hypothetical protein
VLLEIILMSFLGSGVIAATPNACTNVNSLAYFFPRFILEIHINNTPSVGQVDAASRREYQSSFVAKGSMMKGVPMKHASDANIK